MTSLESETLKEIEKIKAKAAIAVAVLSNADPSALSSPSTSSKKTELIEMIKKAQATLDD
ncbi:MAG TPA: hypothetical protein DHW80_09250 [Acinetobacter sp.]|uniref:hypothetical protein n=1 Tax=Acinetobacter variabilis TaxID=70346 RepID=UPI000EF01B5D|nr:hypothetical protein [Acinetobacter variabilis]HCL59945.1 hypothetical protein [Acinetobacter sp.]